MGVPKLKIKKELNYGKRSTSKECRCCNHFVKEFEIHGGAGGPGSIAWEPRCKVIGLKPGRVFRINPDLHSDSYDGSNYLKKLRGES